MFHCILGLVALTVAVIIVIIIYLFFGTFLTLFPLLSSDLLWFSNNLWLLLIYI